MPSLSEAHDEEVDDRLRCVETTFAAHRAGRAISNDETLTRLIGADAPRNIDAWSFDKKDAAVGNTQGRQEIADLSNDAAAADALAEAFDSSVIYSNKLWYRKTSQIFEPISEELVQGLAKEFMQKQIGMASAAPLMMKSCLTRGRINAAIELSRSKFHIDAGLIDRNLGLIGCADGFVLNLTTGETGNEDAVITKKLGVGANTTSCPEWLAFLDRIF